MEGIIEYCMLGFRFFCILHVHWSNPALLLTLVCTLLPCYKIGDCTVLQCFANTEVWQTWIIICWLSFRCTKALLEYSRNCVVQQLRKIVPRLEVVPLIISSTRNESIILSRVIWNLLSLSGCYIGFNRLHDKLTRSCWQEEKHNINSSSGSWIIRRFGSAKSYCVVMVLYNTGLSTVYDTQKQTYQSWMFMAWIESVKGLVQQRTLKQPKLTL